MNKQTISRVLKSALPMFISYILFATVFRLWDTFKLYFSGSAVNWSEELGEVDYTGILPFAVAISLYIGYREMKRKQAKEEANQV